MAGIRRAHSASGEATGLLPRSVIASACQASDVVGYASAEFTLAE